MSIFFIWPIYIIEEKLKVKIKILSNALFTNISFWAYKDLKFD